MSYLSIDKYDILSYNIGADNKFKKGDYKMKHCQNCGNQLHDQAVVCTNCGCACAAPQPTYQNYAPNNAGYQPNITQPNPYQQTAYQPNHYQPVVDKESSSTANCALIFAILMPALLRP